MSGALTRIKSNRTFDVWIFALVPHTSGPKANESGAAIRTNSVTAVARVAELMLFMAVTSRINMPTGMTISNTSAGCSAHVVTLTSLTENVNITSDERRLSRASGVSSASSIRASSSLNSWFFSSHVLVSALYVNSSSLPWPNQAKIEPASSSLPAAFAAKRYNTILTTKNWGRNPISTMLSKAELGGNLRLSIKANNRMVIEVKAKASVMSFRCFMFGEGYWSMTL